MVLLRSSLLGIDCPSPSGLGLLPEPLLPSIMSQKKKSYLIRETKVEIAAIQLIIEKGPATRREKKKEREGNDIWIVSKQFHNPDTKDRNVKYYWGCLNAAKADERMEKLIGVYLRKFEGNKRRLHVWLIACSSSNCTFSCSNLSRSIVCTDDFMVRYQQGCSSKARGSLKWHFALLSFWWIIWARKILSR